VGTLDEEELANEVKQRARRNNHDTRRRERCQPKEVR
jgi:hypothetical protein